MCKEDVRIGRQKRAGATLSATLGAGVYVQVMNRNPNRATLFVSVEFPFPADPLCYVVVRAGGGAGAVIGVLNVYRPALVLTVDDAGQAVTDDIWIRAFNPNDEEYHVSEYVWDQELRDL